MISDIEPVIDQRAQAILSNMFSKGGGLVRGNIGGLSVPRGLGG